MFIYKITNKINGKVYIGKTKLPIKDRFKKHIKCAENRVNRHLYDAMNHYGYENFEMCLVESCDGESVLSERETFWIKNYNTLENGYNVTSGGDGHDSESAKLFWKNVSEEWKAKRAINCSIGQQRRYEKSTDSDLTKKRKSDAHKGSYKVTSPDGREWVTTLGLKEFAETYQDEIKITYWQLFSAYRKCYNNKQISVKRNNENLWKVERLD